MGCFLWHIEPLDMVVVLYLRNAAHKGDIERSGCKLTLLSRDS